MARHYDVFINHRGPDVKKAFATRLYKCLTSRGLQVFLDEREMEAGHEISAQIKDAIEVASVHVAIFSSTYAKSEWCLNELLLMEKSRGTILPVFYNVEPSDLKYGAYVEILKQEEAKKRNDPETFENWRGALCRFAKQSGFVLSAFNWDEVELLNKLAESVEGKLGKTRLQVAEHETGLERKFKDFEKKVLSQQQQQSGKARVVGIMGCGGIGKTTLAKKIYNNKRLEYPKASFLGKSSLKSLNDLQNQLLNELRDRKININSPDQGIKILEDYLSDLQALIVLDDIGSIDELRDFFLPIRHVLDPRSLILVTSRDKHVLECAKIEEASIYTLTELDPPHAKELFCQYAFSQRYPQKGFEKHVDDFLSVCNGLPLSLKVCGALLYKQDTVYWESRLTGIHHLPPEIEKSIQISYEALSDVEKQIFLDTACFSIGKNKDTWIRIWDESNWSGVAGFQNLLNKCLVEVDGEGKIRMHDHHRDFGRSIASKSLPVRLWAAKIEDVHGLLEQRSPVRGLKMASRSSRGDTSDGGLFGSTSEMPFSRSSGQCGLSGIKQLRLLEAEGNFVESILTGVHLPNLIWLSWNECPRSSLPSCIPTHGLKVLEVAGRALKKLWQSNSHQAPLQLQELYIDAPLSEFPNPLGQLKNLQKFVVKYSIDEGTHLESLPKELRSLCCLKYLELKRCSKLQTIPDSLGNLTNLRQLNLSGCRSLKRLPDRLGFLTNLQRIDLSECESLSELPDSMENLSNLQHIDLSKCKSLEMLSISLKNLTNLKYINLSGCTSLEQLPGSFVDLINLEHMDLSQCGFLDRLPSSFENLVNIQHINMSGCNNLKSLPGSWENLTNLNHIDLCRCGSLERLPDSLGNLSNLRHINLYMCKSLEELPNFNPNLTNIQDINLNGCKKLKMLPQSIEIFTNLQHIDLSDCESLESLPYSFGELTNLQRLDLRGCSSLKKLPDSFGSLTNLQRLDLRGCSSLETVPESFDRLTNLEHIDLSRCESLKMLPTSFGALQLKRMDLIDCSTLTISSEPLKRVAELYFSTILKRLPSDVVCLSKLELLHLEGPSLEELPPLDHLRSLKKLCLVDCSVLQCLPESVELLTQLNVLEIRDCDIKNLPQAVLKLNNLESLEVCSCPLRQLPFQGESETILLAEGQRASSNKVLPKLRSLDLGSVKISKVSFPRGVCPNLRHVKIKDCEEIVEIGALPTELSTLDLRGCGALRKIAGLCTVANLQKLDTRGCDKIKVEDLPLEALEALVISLAVFGAPHESRNCRDGDLQGRAILASILRDRKRWCNCCTEGVLPFFMQFERMAML